MTGGWAQLGLVALGGGVGGALRHVVTLWVSARTGDTCPWGTLAVNVSGALMLGVLLGVLGPDARAANEAWLLLGIGVLGSYTTVSSLSLQALLLARERRQGTASMYVVATLVAGVAAVFGGLCIGASL